MIGELSLMDAYTRAGASRAAGTNGAASSGALLPGKTNSSIKPTLFTQ